MWEAAVKCGAMSQCPKTQYAEAALVLPAAAAAQNTATHIRYGASGICLHSLIAAIVYISMRSAVSAVTRL